MSTDNHEHPWPDMLTVSVDRTAHHLQHRNTNVENKFEMIITAMREYENKPAVSHKPRLTSVIVPFHLVSIFAW